MRYTVTNHPSYMALISYMSRVDAEMCMNLYYISDHCGISFYRLDRGSSEHLMRSGFTSYPLAGKRAVFYIRLAGLRC